MLKVEGLSIELAGATGSLPLLEDVTLRVERGETVALVGESGSGKTLTGLSLLRLTPPRMRVAAQVMTFDGMDLLTMREERMRRLRGDRIAMVFQEPMTSLNPLLTVGRQIAESLEAHRAMSARAARRRAIELLDEVGIVDPARRVDAYPHELSGGMRQRALIAIALACEPALLIADEPTTALDVTVQAQLLGLLRRMQSRNGMGVLLITHDLGVVAEMADRVCVMYAGRIVETAPVTAIFDAPAHPYTRALLDSRLPLDAAADGARLPVIPGEPPSPRRRPAGCPFHPRCQRRGDEPRCIEQRPTSREIDPERSAACWLAP